MTDRLLTNSKISKWNLGDSRCMYCGRCEETALHILKNCSTIVKVWRHWTWEARVFPSLEC